MNSSEKTITRKKLTELLSGHSGFLEFKKLIPSTNYFSITGAKGGAWKMVLEIISDISDSAIIFTDTTGRPSYESVDSRMSFTEFMKILSEYSYERSEIISKSGEFTQKGDTFLVWSHGYEFPVRVEFWGEDLERISVVDPDTLENSFGVEEFTLIKLPGSRYYFPEKNFEGIILTSSGGGEENLVFDFREAPYFHGNIEVVDKFLGSYNGKHKIVQSKKNEIQSLDGVELYSETPVTQGWRSDELGMILLTEVELSDGLYLPNEISERLESLSKNDLIVHRDHGIGKYFGLIERQVGKETFHYIDIRYAEGDKLLVPTNMVHKVSKYIGGKVPRITRLSTNEWDRIKKRVKKSIENIAHELLDLYAARKLQKSTPFSADTKDQVKFENNFEYTETDDQLKAVKEIKQDMELDSPMDRLLVGDVGFGKTELAMRAAFKAVQDDKLVVVLAPTTVLAQQHLSVFLDRMKGFAINIALLSRFVSKTDQDKVIKLLKNGGIDIVIGTHRLLSDDIEYKDLGLVIVDEEHRFGVKQKEKLKHLKANVDYLAMSATPIPRSMNLSLTGIKSVSLLAEAPPGRLAIKTYMEEYEDLKITKHINSEIERGGQVFYIHNDIQTLLSAVSRLTEQLPDVKFSITHGRMNKKTLINNMDDFLSGRTNVLASTTIVENGLDLPNVNTILIDNAHKLGLAQLHQLRGRVGRSSTQAFCYLIYPKGAKLSSESSDRLNSIVDFQQLGAGFQIASKDLDIRGAGNILGKEQSGNIVSVGYSLYLKLLNEKVKQLKQVHASVS